MGTRFTFEDQTYKHATLVATDAEQGYMARFPMRSASMRELGAALITLADHLDKLSPLSLVADEPGLLVPDAAAPSAMEGEVRGLARLTMDKVREAMVAMPPVPKKPALWVCDECAEDMGDDGFEVKEKWPEGKLVAICNCCCNGPAVNRVE